MKKLNMRSVFYLFALLPLSVYASVDSSSPEYHQGFIIGRIFGAIFIAFVIYKIIKNFSNK